ncbi:unnamed protein product [Tilletia caries]|nr:unnamed protein product [Tilletia caries]
MQDRFDKAAADSDSDRWKSPAQMTVFLGARYGFDFFFTSSGRRLGRLPPAPAPAADVEAAFELLHDALPPTPGSEPMGRGPLRLHLSTLPVPVWEAKDQAGPKVANAHADTASYPAPAPAPVPAPVHNYAASAQIAPNGDVDDVDEEEAADEGDMADDYDPAGRAAANAPEAAGKTASSQTLPPLHPETAEGEATHGQDGADADADDASAGAHDDMQDADRAEAGREAAGTAPAAEAQSGTESPHSAGNPRTDPGRSEYAHHDREAVHRYDERAPAWAEEEGKVVRLPQNAAAEANANRTTRGAVDHVGPYQVQEGTSAYDEEQEHPATDPDQGPSTTAVHQHASPTQAEAHLPAQDSDHPALHAEDDEDQDRTGDDAGQAAAVMTDLPGGEAAWDAGRQRDPDPDARIDPVSRRRKGPAQIQIQTQTRQAAQRRED